MCVNSRYSQSILISVVGIQLWSKVQNREREKIFHFFGFLALRARAARPSCSTATPASHMLPLNSSRDVKRSHSLIRMVSSTRIHSINVCLSLRRWTATETKCSFCGHLGPTTELSSVCLQCGSSSQTEILHSSVLFHAHCFTCVRPPAALFRYLIYFEKISSSYFTVTSSFMIFCSSTTLRLPLHLSFPQFHPISVFLPLL